MPDLTDVEHFKRYADSTSLHRRIKKVELDAPRMLRVAPAAASAQGGKCPHCGGALQQKHSSGRTAYFCPRCQQ